MCGILAVEGSFRFDHIPEALIERGKDDQGVYQDDFVQLMQTRLEITPCKIELPFQDNDCVLLFNGEIYNWQDLAEKVGGENEYQVILNTWKRFGNDLHEFLDGQFSIIIYNKYDHSISYFHDPFNIHVVYFVEYQGSKIYASNLRSLPEGSFEFKQLNQKGFGNITTAKVL